MQDDLGKGQTQSDKDVHSGHTHGVFSIYKMYTNRIPDQF